jgi:hypothetical protein
MKSIELHNRRAACSDVATEYISFAGEGVEGPISTRGQTLLYSRYIFTLWMWPLIQGLPVYKLTVDIGYRTALIFLHYRIYAMQSSIQRERRVELGRERWIFLFYVGWGDGSNVS